MMWTLLTTSGLPGTSVEACMELELVDQFLLLSYASRSSAHPFLKWMWVPPWLVGVRTMFLEVFSVVTSTPCGL